MDIAHGIEVVLVRTNRLAPVWFLKYAANATRNSLEVHCIRLAELFHEIPEAITIVLQQDMDVIAHKAICMNVNLVRVDSLLEFLEAAAPIRSILKYNLAARTFRNDVVKPCLALSPSRMRHVHHLFFVAMRPKGRLPNGH